MADGYGNFRTGEITLCMYLPAIRVVRAFVVELARWELLAGDLVSTDLLIILECSKDIRGVEYNSRGRFTLLENACGRQRRQLEDQSGNSGRGRAFDCIRTDWHPASSVLR